MTSHTEESTNSRHSGIDLLDWIDRQPLRARYWIVVALLGLTVALDFFDFYVVAFLVAFLAPSWHLTYGQSGIILISAGIGSIIGALLFGMIADRIGRKPSIVLGSVLCGLCSLGIALLPDGAWQLFAMFRFGVGMGLAATMTGVIALGVEHTPTSLRTFIGSALVVFSSGGPLIASLTMSSMIEALGWRGVAALGALPLILGLLAIVVVPESTRWLASRGRVDAARRSASAITMTFLAQVPQHTAASGSVARSASITELLRYPRALALTILIWLGTSVANYGVYLWGPTILALKEGLTIKQAAGLFVYVALAGLAGKLVFSYLPYKLGRVPAGLIGGYGMALCLGTVALAHNLQLDGVSVLLLMLVVGALFYEGTFANLSPYSAEIFPVAVAARGVGAAQAANGFGKIIGPMSLAVIAGTNNLITPSATAAAITPGFMLMAGAGMIVALGFQFLGIETHRRPLVTDDSAAIAIEPAVGRTSAAST